MKATQVGTAIATKIHSNEEKHPLATEGKQLLEILRYKRPHGTDGEEVFCKRYLDPLLKKVNARKDKIGNYHIIIGTVKSPVLFSCHTDTVHAGQGQQVVIYNPKTAIAFIDNPKTKGKQYFGDCLGADDGTGLWIMLNMIRTGVHGYYIFHRGEERGGIGSGWLSKNWETEMSAYNIKIAIAFDRKGKTDLITHQAGSRCASEKSAKEIIALLQAQGLTFKASNRGTFTDTANYKHLVSECYNMSVGYEKQHGPNETQDMDFAHKLMKACCKINWRTLTAYRDPKVIEPIYEHSYGQGYSSRYGDIDTSDWAEVSTTKIGQNENTELARLERDEILDDVPPPAMRMTEAEVLAEYTQDATYKDVKSFVLNHPLAVIEYLMDFGFSEADMIEALEGTTLAKTYANKLRERINMRMEDDIEPYDTLGV